MKSRVLVVDDDPALAEMLTIVLRGEGFDTAVVADGTRALPAVRELRPDVVLLDLMLPGMNGIDVCRAIRSESGVPIVMLTAKSDTVDIVLGLESGADDYVVKPFSPGELVARVKAQLRRVEMDTSALASSGVLRGGEVILDPTARMCTARGKAVDLTPKEFDLLNCLMAHAGRVLSRDDLLTAVWDEDFFGYPGTVTVHIRRLREKIERDPDLPTHIKTVWGLGYKFDPTLSQRTP